MMSTLSSSHQPTIVRPELRGDSEDAPTQLLEMVEKRHLTARGHIGVRRRPLGPEALLILPREIGLGGARIDRDHPE